MHPSCSSGAAGAPSCKRIPYGIFLISFLIIPAFLQAQQKSDIGISAGTSYYLGDLNFTGHFRQPAVAGGALIRYNINPRNSFRFSGIYANLGGRDPVLDDDFHSVDAFRTSIIDLAFATEFNFREYKTTKLRKSRFTPYLSGGLSYTVVMWSDVPAEHTPGLAFGGGAKYNLTKRLGTGFEASFRKTFNDMLDGVSNPGEENNVFFHNKDWYALVQVFITYKIFDWRVDCPAYD